MPRPSMKSWNFRIWQTSGPRTPKTERSPNLRSLARILHVGNLVELDVVQRAADLLDLADVDRLRDVARLGIDHDGAARARQLDPLERRDELLGVGRAAGLLERLGDERHPVVAADRHEIRPELGAVHLRVRLLERLVL